MRARVTVAGATVLTVALALIACGESGGAAQQPDAVKQQGIRGRIVDATCFGPCTLDATARPYEGDATVVTRRLAPNGRTKTATVRDSRFRQTLTPGRYGVIAKIDDPCWSTQARKVRLGSDQWKRVRLVVSNDCIR